MLLFSRISCSFSSSRDSFEIIFDFWNIRPFMFIANFFKTMTCHGILVSNRYFTSIGVEIIQKLSFFYMSSLNHHQKCFNAWVSMRRPQWIKIYIENLKSLSNLQYLLPKYFFRWISEMLKWGAHFYSV